MNTILFESLQSFSIIINQNSYEERSQCPRPGVRSHNYSLPLLPLDGGLHGDEHGTRGGRQHGISILQAVAPRADRHVRLERSGGQPAQLHTRTHTDRQTHTHAAVRKGRQLRGRIQNTGTVYTGTVKWKTNRSLIQMMKKEQLERKVTRDSFMLTC